MSNRCIVHDSFPDNPISSVYTPVEPEQESWRVRSKWSFGLWSTCLRGAQSYDTIRTDCFSFRSYGSSLYSRHPWGCVRPTPPVGSRVVDKLRDPVGVGVRVVPGSLDQSTRVR